MLTGVITLLAAGLLFQVWGNFLPAVWKQETVWDTVSFLSEVTPVLFTSSGWESWFPVVPGSEVRFSETPPEITVLSGKDRHRFLILSLEPGRELSITLPETDPLVQKGFSNRITVSVSKETSRTRIRLSEEWTIRHPGYRTGFYFSMKNQLIRRQATMMDRIRQTLGNR